MGGIISKLKNKYLVINNQETSALRLNTIFDRTVFDVLIEVPSVINHAIIDVVCHDWKIQHTQNV